MGILHIEHRIIIGFFLGQVQVKVQLTVDGTHHKEEPGRVRSYFINQFVQGHALAGPFGHLHFLPVPQQTDHLQNQNFQLFRLITHALHGRFHPGNVPVMVRAPQIDDPVKAPAEFIGVVSDIRRKVSRNAIIPNHHPVLVVAECGRLQPQGPVLFIHVTLFQQSVTGFFDFICFVQGLFTEPYIKADVETFQIFLQRRQFFLISDGLELFQPFCFLHLQETVAILVDDTLGRIDNVVTVVSVLGEFDFFSQQFQIPGIDGTGQIVHLVAGVVDIVFLLHVIPRRLQQIGQSTAYRRAPSVSHVQRTGGVGADIFQLYLFIRRFRQIAVILPGFHDAGQHVVHPVRVQIKIDKTGSGNFRFLHIGAVQIFHNVLSQYPGIAPQSSG